MHDSSKASAAARAWGRILLVQGDAPKRYMLREHQPAHLIVGSDPSAHILIRSDSAAPRQFDVLWDGQHLWLEDKLRLGRTFVAGQRLNEWVLVQQDVMVCFAMVRMWMAAGGPSTRPTTPDFDAIERARLARDGSAEDVCRRSPTGRVSITPDLERRLAEARFTS